MELAKPNLIKYIFKYPLGRGSASPLKSLFLRSTACILSGLTLHGFLYSSTLANTNLSLLGLDGILTLVPLLWPVLASISLIVLYTLFFVIFLPHPASYYFVGLFYLLLLSILHWLNLLHPYWMNFSTLLFVQLLSLFVFISYKLTSKENLAWKLAQEKEAQKQYDTLKNNFLSLISHDLKTPLAKIQGTVEKLTLQENQTVTENDVELLQLSTQELKRYIKKLIQASKLQSEEIQVHKKPHDFNKIVLDVIMQLQPLAQRKSIDIKQNLEPLFLVEVDWDMTREAVVNIVENAIKYTPHGGSVSISTSEENHFIKLLVKDTGPGVNSEDQEIIFEKFKRSPQNSATLSGNGLGLYLVKYFMELQGGSVKLTSSPQGSAFEIQLPLTN